MPCTRPERTWILHRRPASSSSASIRNRCCEPRPTARIHSRKHLSGVLLPRPTAQYTRSRLPTSMNPYVRENRSGTGPWYQERLRTQSARTHRSYICVPCLRTVGQLDVEDQNGSSLATRCRRCTQIPFVNCCFLGKVASRRNS